MGTAQPLLNSREKRIRRVETPAAGETREVGEGVKAGEDEDRGKDKGTEDEGGEGDVISQAAGDS